MKYLIVIEDKKFIFKISGEAVDINDALMQISKWLGKRPSFDVEKWQKYLEDQWNEEKGL